MGWPKWVKAESWWNPGPLPSSHGQERLFQRLSGNRPDFQLLLGAALTFMSLETFFENIVLHQFVLGLKRKRCSFVMGKIDTSFRVLGTCFIGLSERCSDF